MPKCRRIRRLYEYGSRYEHTRLTLLHKRTEAKCKPVQLRLLLHQLNVRSTVVLGHGKGEREKSRHAFMCIIGHVCMHLLIVGYVGRREVEPKSVPTVVRVRSNLDLVLALAQLGHLADIATGTMANDGKGDRRYVSHTVIRLVCTTEITASGFVGHSQVPTL